MGAALRDLPEMETCPHELYEVLLQSPAKTRKRVALITEHDRPVALAGLLQRKRHWQPVVDAVVSVRAAMPARPGYLFPAIAALGLDIWTGGHEGPPPPNAPGVRRVFPLPTYRMDCAADFEGYWRHSGQLNSIKYSRRHSAGLAFEVDGAGAVAWIVRGWESRWRDHPAGETIAAEDQLLAAEYYQARGKMHAFRLLDGDTPVAGQTFYVHRNSLVFKCTYRDARHERQGVGTRLTELIFDWARASGYAYVDMGSGHDYKERWAPPNGERWYCNVCPTHLYVPKQLVRFGRGLVATALAVARGRAKPDDSGSGAAMSPLSSS